MLFSRMIVKNVEMESLEESPKYIYNVTSEDKEDERNNHFNVAEILLLDNGWVKVATHDGGSECFPPWRVIILEGWI